MYVCVCSFLYPSPCIYRREPPRDRSSSLQNRHWEPVREHHVAKLRRWGPWAWSAGLPVGPPTSPFGPRVPSWAHLSLAWVLALVLFVSCSGGPSIPYSDMSLVLICWNVVSWIKPHHYTAKSAGNHLHTF